MAIKTISLALLQVFVLWALVFPVKLFGAQEATLPDDLALLRVHIQAIVLSDDDGSRQAQVDAVEIEQWVSFANSVYKRAGIVFEFNKDQIVSLKSTRLNSMMGEEDKSWAQTQDIGNSIASRYPNKIVVFFRWGAGERPTGAGFGSFRYNFVVMPGYKDDEHCGHPHVDALAHELGHYLGLAHTFAVCFSSEDEARQHLRAHDNSANCFDYDRLDDTLPDPLIRSNECNRVKSVILDGHIFQLPRRNIMSYYDERDTVSSQQINIARFVLKERLANHMCLYTKVSRSDLRSAPGRKVIYYECEDLTQIADPRGNGIQNMSQFSSGWWLNDSQVFNTSGDCALRFRVPEAGFYDVCLYATRAPDYGSIIVNINEVPVQRFDMYAPIVIPTGPIYVGMAKLRQGDNVLTVTKGSKNPRSTGTFFGLDAISLSQRD